MKMNPVVHFEMPADDKDRMATFYSEAFGWKTNKLGPEMGGYVLVETGDTGEDGRAKEAGVINGGFFDRSADNQYPSVVISVDDIHEAMKRVKESGGKVLGGQKGDGEPDDIPGVGMYCSIIDTEGNRVGMLQPSGM